MTEIDLGLEEIAKEMGMRDLLILSLEKKLAAQERMMQAQPPPPNETAPATD